VISLVHKIDEAISKKTKEIQPQIENIEGLIYQQVEWLN